MRITLDLPDKTKCLNVCIVYDGRNYPVMEMAATLRGTDDLQDGATFRIPNREKETEIEDDE